MEEMYPVHLTVGDWISWPQTCSDKSLNASNYYASVSDLYTHKMTCVAFMVEHPG